MKKVKAQKKRAAKALEKTVEDKKFNHKNQKNRT